MIRTAIGDVCRFFIMRLSNKSLKSQTADLSQELRASAVGGHAGDRLSRAGDRFRAGLWSNFKTPVLRIPRKHGGEHANLLYGGVGGHGFDDSGHRVLA